MDADLDRKISSTQENLLVQEAINKLLNFLKKENYQFVTPSPITHERWLKKNPNRLAIDLREVFGWCLSFTESLINPRIFELLFLAKLIIPKGNTWKSKIRVSTLGNELFVHSAFPTVEYDSVFFGPDTYRFLNYLNLYFDESSRQIENAVELCCGASPAAITIAEHCPFATVQAIDINSKALMYSDANARAAGVKIRTVYNNLLHDSKTHFDLIVANPPFMMDKNKRAYRDGGDNFGAELALRIVTESLQRLTPNGVLLLYTGSCIVAGKDVFYELVKKLLSNNPDFEWRYQQIDVDIFSEELLVVGYEEVERIAAVWLQIWKKI